MGRGGGWKPQVRLVRAIKAKCIGVIEGGRASPLKPNSWISLKQSIRRFWACAQKHSWGLDCLLLFWPLLLFISIDGWSILCLDSRLPAESDQHHLPGQPKLPQGDWTRSLVFAPCPLCHAADWLFHAHLLPSDGQGKQLQQQEQQRFWWLTVIQGLNTLARGQLRGYTQNSHRCHHWRMQVIFLQDSPELQCFLSTCWHLHYSTWRQGIPLHRRLVIPSGWQVICSPNERAACTGLACTAVEMIHVNLMKWCLWAGRPWAVVMLIWNNTV